MANQGEITLAAGTTFVSVSMTPELIATALYPRTSAEPTVSYLRKVREDSSARQWRPEELTPEEMAFLNQVWSELPPYVDGISRSAWESYAAAVERIDPKPDWRPVPVWHDPGRIATMNRADAVVQHERALSNAINDGRVITRTHAMVPLAATHRSMPTARILIPDLERYVADLGLIVRVEEPPAAKPANSRRTVGEVVRQLGEQMAAAHREEWERAGANNEIRSDSAAAQCEVRVLADIDVLRRKKLIRARLADGAEIDPMSEIDRAWRLSRTDLDHVLQYTQRDGAPKQAYLVELTAYRATGRHTLQQAADHIAGEADEDYKAILARLKLAALKDELPMYLPDSNLKHDYGPAPRRKSAVRDFYEEAYWSDLNNWLATFEPRVEYRFPPPQEEPEVVVIPRRPKVTQLHAEAVLEALKLLGVDPMRLPRTSPGVDGIRKQVSVRVSMTSATFKRTWQRLLSSGLIQYAET